MRYSSSERSESRSHRGSSRRARTIQYALLRWYKEKGRDLPWRHTRDPYKVLVSEIMLQQTQVDRVIPKYRIFLRLFPTVEKLAKAPRSAIIHAWAGLGYNRRAVYLHEAAKKVVHDFGGKVPTTVEALRQLSGVGEYTAAAVACFSGGARVPLLDTNIKRIVGRLFFDTKKRRLPLEKKLRVLTETILPTKQDDVYLFPHALMDLGALVCVAGRPQCEGCPLQRSCPFPPFRDLIKKSHYAKRQPSFKDSDRFWRGRILAFIRKSKKSVRVGPLARSLGIVSSRCQKLIAGLVRDGLLVQNGARFSLPQ